MSWEDVGGPQGLDKEAHRIAYMLDTGNASAAHEAAYELSQDLNGLPNEAAVDLIRRTQAYEEPNVGADLVVKPIYAQDRNGNTVDVGLKDILVQGPNVNDEVAILQANPRVRDTDQDAGGTTTSLIDPCPR